MKTYLVYKLIALVVIMPLFVISCAITPRHEIKVPGGLSQEKTTNLWNVAKNECYNMGYAVVNEDKSTGNLVCQKEDSNIVYSVRVHFTNTGFLVQSRCGDSIDSIPVVRALKMGDIVENALKKAAGL